MTKPLARSLATYSDITPILDAAIASGGAILTLPSRREAVAWRHRAYAARSLRLKNEAAAFAHIPGHFASTPWDPIHISIEEPGGGGKVWINVREANAAAVGLTDLEGRPLAVGAATSNPQPTDTELADFARSFAEGLK